MRWIDVEMFGAPAFSLMFGANGGLHFAGINDILCAQSGLLAADVIGRSPRECFPPTVASHMETQYRHCLKLRSTYEYEEHLDLPGDAKWWRTTLSPIIDPETSEVLGLLGLTTDITDRKRDELELRSAAFKDPLTGICNRRRFDRDLDAAFTTTVATGRPFAIVLADVDRFKEVNDTHGHTIGDVVLKELANRLAACTGANDRLARIGGDEFALILAVETEETLAVALEGLRERLDGAVEAGDLSLDVTLSLGAALWCKGMTKAAMLADADAAMYRVKRAAVA